MTTEFQAALVALLPRLRRLARARVGNPDEADDLVQATCERAWRSRAQWTPGTQFENWVFTIMHNLRVDQIRAATARGIDAGPDALETLADERWAPQLEASVTLDRVAQAMTTLPEAMREVLSAVTVEGLSYQDAARMLGLPMGTVMSRLARARVELMKRLGLEGGEVLSGGASR